MEEDVIAPKSFTDKERFFFQKHIHSASVYNEFGAGWTTLCASRAENLREIHCVESNSQWLKKIFKDNAVRSAVADGRLSVWLTDFKGWHNHFGAPLGIGGMNLWPTYSWSCWKNLSRKADLVLIDGRFRVACAISTALFLDNPDATILVHDYPDGNKHDRIEYRFMEKYYDIVERADSFAAMKLKSGNNRIELMLHFADFAFKPFDRDFAYDGQNYEGESDAYYKLVRKFGSLEKLWESLEKPSQNGEF